jgi:NAD-dependent deacetylase
MSNSQETLRTETARRAAERVRAAERLCVLTGAGVSAESGVPTFRGAQGLWRSFRPEDLATPEAFARDPLVVWEWYAWRRDLVAAVAPNAAHHALAAHPALRLVTQNVDGLHAAAGSRDVVEMHGSLWRTRCTGCGTRAEQRGPLGTLPPRCACGALLRPDIVWFGEALPADAIAAAFSAATRADVVMVVGTSGLVHPAAALPLAARDAGAYVIEVNPDETPLSATAHACLRAPASEAVPFLLGRAA